MKVNDFQKQNQKQTNKQINKKLVLGIYLLNPNCLGFDLHSPMKIFNQSLTFWKVWDDWIPCGFLIKT